jgi:hypothetical protein
MNSLKNYDELSKFEQGLIKGQFIMIETMKLQLNSSKSTKEILIFLAIIEKQLETGELPS